MNEHLRDRVLRKLETLSDERGYQVLDYVEFLESKYAERQTPAQGIFARFSEAVEDRLRAGKISASAIAETMSLMNRAMNVLNGVATGVAAASRSVASDLAASASRGAGQPPAGNPTAGSAAPSGTGGASVAASGAGSAAPPPPERAVEPAAPTAAGDRPAGEDGELNPPLDQRSET
jgi:hypothetical protein